MVMLVGPPNNKTLNTVRDVTVVVAVVPYIYHISGLLPA